MNVYIWTDLAQVSDNYHAGGGLIVVAFSLNQARMIVASEHPHVVIDKKPDQVIRGVPNYVAERVIVMACADPYAPRDGDPI